MPKRAILIKNIALTLGFACVTLGLSCPAKGGETSANPTSHRIDEKIEDLVSDRLEPNQKAEFEKYVHSEYQNFQEDLKNYNTKNKQPRSPLANLEDEFLLNLEQMNFKKLDLQASKQLVDLVINAMELTHFQETDIFEPLSVFEDEILEYKSTRVLAFMLRSKNLCSEDFSLSEARTVLMDHPEVEFRSTNVLLKYASKNRLAFCNRYNKRLETDLTCFKVDSTSMKPRESKLEFNDKGELIFVHKPTQVKRDLKSGWLTIKVSNTGLVEVKKFKNQNNVEIDGRASIYLDQTESNHSCQVNISFRENENEVTFVLKPRTQWDKDLLPDKSEEGRYCHVSTKFQSFIDFDSCTLRTGEVTQSYRGQDLKKGFLRYKKSQL